MFNLSKTGARLGNSIPLQRQFQEKRRPKEGSWESGDAGVDSNPRIPDPELRILWLESQDSNKLLGDQCIRRVHASVVGTLLKLRLRRHLSMH